MADWWLSEVESDPAYAEVVTPLLLEVLRPEPGRTYLDLGCGEGRVMREIAAAGAVAHGVDINRDLAGRAGQAVVADLLHLPMRDDSYDGVFSVLTVEHVADHRAFFAETARVARPDGCLVVVANHPVWTAPGSTPIADADGETLWRPGNYFSDAVTELRAGEATVEFHHRSMAELLSSAASKGWSLESLVEQPHHEYEDQEGIPRLLACRWRLLP